MVLTWSLLYDINADANKGDDNDVDSSNEISFCNNRNNRYLKWVVVMKVIVGFYVFATVSERRMNEYPSINLLYLYRYIFVLKIILRLHSVGSRLDEENVD